MSRLTNGQKFWLHKEPKSVETYAEQLLWHLFTKQPVIECYMKDLISWFECSCIDVFSLAHHHTCCRTSTSVNRLKALTAILQCMSEWVKFNILPDRDYCIMSKIHWHIVNVLNYHNKQYHYNHITNKECTIAPTPRPWRSDSSNDQQVDAQSLHQRDSTTSTLGEKNDASNSGTGQWLMDESILSQLSV